MTEIISVRFKSGGKDYYFNPNGEQYQPGDQVIIETSRGAEFGECTQGNTMVDEMTLVSPLRPVLRRATEEDLRVLAENRRKEERAFALCESKILEHELDMKLVEVEYNFEGNKVLFFFTSDGRVDFRDLVKDLASVLHTRIELRQIGVRDEAKLLGGLGICGRPFCCTTFLEDFQPVSIKMAKTQNLSLNPTKISGTCGRLMCCLKYEQFAYEDAVKRCPRNESLVETPDGVGTICAVNLLRETARVRLDNDPDTAAVYPCEDLKVIRSGKGKRPEGYELPEQPAPAQRTLKGLRETPAEKPAPRAEEKPAEKPEEKPVQPERPAREKPRRERPQREKPAEQPAPKPVEKPAEKPVEQPAEQRPAENAAPAGRRPSRRRSRGARPEGEKKPENGNAEQPRERRMRKPKPAAPQSAEGAKPAAEGKEGEAPRRSRSHSRSHRRPRGGGDSQPKQEG